MIYWFVYLFIYCMNLQALGDLEQVESVRSPGSYIPSNGEEKSLETTAKVLLLRVLLHANVLFLQEAQLLKMRAFHMNRIPLIGWFGWSSRELCDWNFKAGHYFCRIPDCHMMAPAGTFLRRETPAPSCAKLLEHFCRKWRLLPTVRR